MTHARWIVALSCIVGCGTSGEPLHGDVMMTYGTAAPKLVVGSAVEDKQMAGNMLVQLGTDNVDCGMNLGDFGFSGPPSGVYVAVSVSKTVPVTDPQASIEVIKTDGANININISSGSVMIDSSDTRVMGSLTFSTTDDQAGPITVSGGFDVKKCF
jgi:hypothetical protein